MQKLGEVAPDTTPWLWAEKSALQTSHRVRVQWLQKYCSKQCGPGHSLPELWQEPIVEGRQ